MSTSSAPSQLKVSELQFKTIGRQPALLQRMSTPDDVQMSQGSDRASLSPSIHEEHDVLNNLLPSDESAKVQPSSLHVRMMMDDTVNQIMPANPPSTGSSARSIFDWKPAAVSAYSSNGGSSLVQSVSQTFSTNSGYKLSERPSNNKIPSDRSRISRQANSNSMDLDHSMGVEVANVSGAPKVLVPSQQTFPAPPSELSIVPIHSSSSVPLEDTSINQEFLSSERLRTLHLRLSASIANLKPISTEDARNLARIAREQCTEVSASADRAYQLACKAIASAQESMNAARECISAAETIRVRTSDVMAAVEKIDTQGQEVWNELLRVITADLHQLDGEITRTSAQGVKGRYDPQAERRNQGEPNQLDSSISSHPNPSTIISKQDNLHSTFSDTDLRHRQSNAISVENEVQAPNTLPNIPGEEAERHRMVEEELNKRREEELMKLREAEETFKKHQAAEEALKQEQERTHALVVAARAELVLMQAGRLAEEGREKARREEGIQDEENQKELFVRQTEVNEENALKAAEGKKEQHATRLLTERVGEMPQKEVVDGKKLERCLEMERRVLEELHEKQLQEQESRRQEISAQKQRAAAEAAKAIQSNRAKLKQANLIQNDPTSSRQNASLSPVLTHEDQPQIPESLRRISGEAVNAVVKQTVGVENPEGKRKIRTSADADSEHLLHRIQPFSKTSFSKDNEARVNSLPPPTASSVNGNATGKSRKVNADASSTRSKEMHALQSSKSPSVGVGNDTIVSNQLLSHASPINESLRVDVSKTSKDNGLNNVVTPTSSTLPALARANVVSNDPNVDDLSLIPRSHILPLSPEVQRANLRPLMAVNGIPHVPSVKRDPDEAPVNLENSAVPNTSTSVTISGGVKVGSLKKKIKRESPSEIPFLSLPTPSPAATSSSDPTPSPTEQSAAIRTQTSGAKPFDFTRLERGSKANVQFTQNAISTPTQPSEPPKQVPSKTLDSGNKPHVRGISADLPGSKVAPIATLPPRPPVPLPSVTTKKSSLASATSHPTAVTNVFTAYENPLENDLASRMGPDIASEEGWNHQVTREEYTPDPVPDHLQHRQRPPAHERRREFDHYPRSLSPVNIHENRISRGVDHYSPPRRAFSPAATHSRYLKPTSDPRGPNSDNNSRPVTSEHAYNRRSPPYSSAGMGRKRARPDDQSAGPPNRRARYELDIGESTLQNGPSRPQYLASASNHQEDWSRIATYSRSPPPDHEHRAPPLSTRLEHNHQRPQAGGNQARQGHNNNYRPASTQNNYINRRPPQMTEPGGQPSYGRDPNWGNSNQSNEYHHANHEVDNNAPPSFLSRLTDSPGYPPANQRYPPNGKGTARRGRGGGPNPSSGQQRNPKPSLINRLEVSQDQ